MAGTAAIRTPGLYFETAAPAPREVLPRLDVAAFVGFAASGPLDVPVPVEDPAGFEEVFGKDLTLDSAGRGLPTQLAPAVRAFFRQGGRRCWVVRVARSPIANTFVLPGILAINRGSPALWWTPAAARARSEGSWSDAVAVNTTLTVHPVPPHAVRWDDDRRSFAVTLDTGRDAIRPGELLRVQTDTPGLSAFVAIPEDPIADVTRRVLVPADDAVWVEEADAEPWPFDDIAIAAVARQVLPNGVRAPLSVLHATRTSGTLRLTLVQAEGHRLREGSWLEIDTLPSNGGPWLLQVERSLPSTPGGSPRLSDASLDVETGRAWRLTRAPISSPPIGVRSVSALTFELWTHDERRRSVRLTDLGFAPGHRRYWGSLPTDTELFRSPELALTDQRALARDASHPRFPLAGPVHPDGAAKTIFLPLGVPALPRAEMEEYAQFRPEPASVRDGLGRIDADLFLDPALRATSADALIDEAFHIRYGGGEGPGRPLRGVHALTYVDEISIVAAPDALLAERSDVETYPAPAGVTLDAITTDTDVTLAWPALEGAFAYTVQQSDTADFAVPSLSDRLDAATFTVYVTRTPVVMRRIERALGLCAPARWYRVRAEGAAGGGPWSNSVRIVPPATTFEPVAQLDSDAPALMATRSSEGTITLSWGARAGLRYQLEFSVEPTFAAAHLLFEGTGGAYTMQAPHEFRYFRVRALTAPAGAWSNTLRVDPAGEAAPLTQPARA